MALLTEIENALKENFEHQGIMLSFDYDASKKTVTITARKRGESHRPRSVLPLEAFEDKNVTDYVSKLIVDSFDE